MSVTNVNYLPPSSSFTVDQALESAKQLGMTDVLILGYDSGGELCVRSSKMERKDALWLLEEAKLYAMCVRSE